MRLPERTFTAIWITCLFVAMVCGSSWAGSSGTITGVKVDPEKRTITIATKGQASKHVARVIGRPNRLVIDFDGAAVGEVPRSIQGAGGDIHEIRVGLFNSQARVVVDFQNHPVPPFDVKRDGGRLLVVLGGNAAGNQTAANKNSPNRPVQANASESQLTPSFVPAVAGDKAPEMRSQAPMVPASPAGPPAFATNYRSAPPAPPVQAQAFATRPQMIPQAQAVGTRPQMIPPAQPVASRPQMAPQAPHAVAVAPQLAPLTQPAAAQPRMLAQAGDTNAPSSVPFPRRGTGPADDNPPARGNGDSVAPEGQPGGPRTVREVRPPVTPPTPDPRLLVQEITELKFVQVGHNARLVIRGGDHLDYRLNKLSPTKVKIDLINAEIPKAHQKPLKTDGFSTSVEMLVPGAQTIFVQLKDAVPYQVEKQKGVLMVDFPPPRMALTPDQKTRQKPTEAGDAPGRELRSQAQDSRSARKEATRILREEQIRQANETREMRIRTLHKEREQLVKKRSEIEKQYEMTADPEVFNKLVTIDFQGISLKNAFRLLAEQAGINIIVAGDLKGSTTLKLSQVPLGQVVDTILTTHDLDREIVGNVMRVGPKKAIQDNKDTRQKQKGRLLLDIDKSIQDKEKQTKDLETQRETSLKELAKEEQAEEPPTEDTTSVETLGEAETIMVEGEPVQLVRRRVRLSYGKAKKIVSIIDCVINNKCSPADLEKKEAKDDLQKSLVGQGFAPGSGGYEARVRSLYTASVQERIASAYERTSDKTGRAASTGGENDMDAKERKLQAHTVLWPDDEYNMIFIRNTPERIEEIMKLIATLDVPTTQVLIEARVVRAGKTWARGLGIQWGGRNNQQGPVNAGATNAATGSALPYGFPMGRTTAIWGVTGMGGSDSLSATSPATMRSGQIPNEFVVNLPTAVKNLSNLMGVAMQFGNLATDHITDLDVRLTLGERAGKSKTISRPKVQVLNDETATIKTGQRIAYSSVSADGTQIQMIDVVLLLNVKPKVYPDGRVQMLISVNDDSVGDIVNGLASINTNSANTTLIVKDGDTAVIGGIMKKGTTHTKEGWPGLMNVPIIGNLFSQKSDDDDLAELLVFINPTIIKRPPPAS